MSEDKKRILQKQLPIPIYKTELCVNTAQLFITAYSEAHNDNSYP